PGEQLVVHVAVARDRAVDAVLEELAATLEQAGDVVAVEHAARLETIDLDRLARRALRLRAPVLLLADLLRAFAADRAIVVGHREAGRHGDDAPVPPGEVAQERDLGLDLMLLLARA